VRGNIKTVVRAHHRDPAWAGEPDPWWRQRPRQPDDPFTPDLTHTV